MKKINSIGYGGKILAVIAVFIWMIPAVIKIMTLVSDNLIFAVCARVSLGIGVLLALFFIGLLAVELHQDKRMNLFFEHQKNQKLCLGKGIYECQACGNRILKSEDKNCSVCGILFQEHNKKSATNR